MADFLFPQSLQKLPGAVSPSNPDKPKFKAFVLFLISQSLNPLTLTPLSNYS